MGVPGTKGKRGHEGLSAAGTSVSRSSGSQQVIRIPAGLCELLSIAKLGDKGE